MPISLSNRLLGCAGCVRPGARVVDVGTDHGLLPIYLLQHGIAAHVIATDLRQKPLESARRNARRFGLEAQIIFVQTDGLRGVPPDAFDTMLCAGMGADSMTEILRAAPWLCAERYRLILQPQSSAYALRRWLSEHGFAITRELLTTDTGFLYCVIEAQAGACPPLSPGEHFISRQLLHSGDPLLPDYLRRIEGNLEKTVDGLQRARRPVEPEKLRYYRTALDEVRQMRG